MQPMTTDKDKLIYVDYGDVCRDPNQPRKTFDQESLSELADSISEVGLIQPIVVHELEPNSPLAADGAKYVIVGGERRWRACGLAGLLKIPVVVKEQISSYHSAIISFRENSDRKGLNVIEEANFLLTLKEEYVLTVREVAAATGLSKSVAGVRLAIAEKLSGKAKEFAVEIGYESATNLSIIANVEDKSSHISLLKMCVSNNWTRSKLKKEVDAYNQNQEIEEDGDLGRELAAQVERVQRMVGDQTGYECKLATSTSGDGSISLKFSSNEELQGILERLGVSEDKD